MLRKYIIKYIFKIYYVIFRSILVHEKNSLSHDLKNGPAIGVRYDHLAFAFNTVANDHPHRCILKTNAYNVEVYNLM